MVLSTFIRQVQSDLKAFDGKPWNRKVDIITAGYPCQPFSLAGNRKGEDDPRHLWPDVKRVIQETGARWVFCENVPGHINLGFDRVVSDLSEMGFQIEADVFSAAEIGASQIRERLFFLAYANGETSGQYAVNEAEGKRLAVDEDKLSVRNRKGGNSVATGLYNRGKVSETASPSNKPLFAPYPDQCDLWDNMLEISPDLQPALHRPDTGVADWLDRSTASGNGVCSLAAAYAYRTLKARLMSLYT